MSKVDDIAQAATIMRVSKTIENSEGKQFDNEHETIEVHKFVTQPAIVNIEIPIKMTKYYNSMGITVGVQLPCYKEEIDAGIEKAKEIALTKVFGEIPAIKQALENMRD